MLQAVKEHQKHQGSLEMAPFVCLTVRVFVDAKLQIASIPDVNNLDTWILSFSSMQNRRNCNQAAYPTVL